MSQVKGIDVSRHNGKIDWAKVKAAGVEFAILRAGYGKLASQKDSKFEEYYAACVKNGIKVGAYWYSYATSAAEAKQEAEACYQCIKGKKFEYPIYFDYEDPTIMPPKVTSDKAKTLAKDIIPAFINTLENKGYFVGLYTFKAIYDAYVPADYKTRYSIWIAHVTDSGSYTFGASPRKETTVTPYDMWQFTWKGKLDGAPYNTVDLDVCIRDFPTIIVSKGFNGYTASSSVVEDIKEETKPVTPPPSSTVTETPVVEETEKKTYTAGEKITLSKTKLYSASTSKNAVTTKTGTFYIYSSEIVNGRIRITNSVKNVGKTPASNYVTGWIEV